jgi:hypothetical protein
MIYCFLELSWWETVSKSLQCYEKRDSTFEEIRDILIEEGFIFDGYFMEKHM